MNNLNSKSCYLCGSLKDLTKDHIPPKNLFPNPKPSDLITVPCCKKCNEEMSTIDESFRVFVSSVINRSKSGDWIWNNKVIGSSFARSKKLKSQTTNSLIEINQTIANQKVKLPALTYPIPKAEKYLIRLVKGFTKHFNPEIDYSKTKYRVANIIPSQEIVNMLSNKFFYVAKGDGVFRMWRMFTKEDRNISIWVFVFYDGLMFMVETK